jgi:hypothetical protein
MVKPTPHIRIWIFRSQIKVVGLAHQATVSYSVLRGNEFRELIYLLETAIHGLLRLPSVQTPTLCASK